MSTSFLHASGALTAYSTTGPSRATAVSRECEEFHSTFQSQSKARRRRSVDSESFEWYDRIPSLARGPKRIKSKKPSTVSKVFRFLRKT